MRTFWFLAFEDEEEEYNALEGTETEGMANVQCYGLTRPWTAEEYPAVYNSNPQEISIGSAESLQTASELTMSEVWVNELFDPDRVELARRSLSEPGRDERKKADFKVLEWMQHNCLIDKWVRSEWIGCGKTRFEHAEPEPSVMERKGSK